MVQIDANKWNVFTSTNLEEDWSESYLELRFRLKENSREIGGIKKEDLQELKKDLEDLGKWGEFKKLKKDLKE
jgi:hypothetical protein